MSSAEHRRPISARHAFALAFDLALRRDPVQSLIVPFLLRAPWSLALMLLPPVEAGAVSRTALALTSLALFGDFLTLLIVGAMLRMRARSVFNVPPEVRPAPAAECYALGMRRIPWLVVTEVVRNLLLALAASLMVLPAALLHFDPQSALRDPLRTMALIAVALVFSLPALSVGYRLGVGTEAVVLDEPHLAGAFERSVRLMRGHVVSWAKLVVASAALALVPALVLAVLSLAFPALAGNAGVTAGWLTVISAAPIVQYAWTFFYLSLVDAEHSIDEPAQTYALGHETGEPSASLGGGGNHAEGQSGLLSDELALK